MSKPIAVLISDVHYDLTTLPLADAATRQAIAKANELNIPLIVAGDLHNTKANMRAECVNAMLETFGLCETRCYILRGNHDAINEKSVEHSLNFLADLAEIVDNPTGRLTSDGIRLIPYSHDSDIVRHALSLTTVSTIIMHQGLNGSESGEYIQDRSALNFEDVKDFRVISGHYHRRQDIKTGRPQKGAIGLFSYIGNPYTMGFGEANDPPKGFQILMDDGLLEFIPTNLRKHVKLDVRVEGRKLCFDNLRSLANATSEDLIWIKALGTKEDLNSINKLSFKSLTGNLDFKLELAPTDTETELPSNSKELTQAETLDTLIDSLGATSDERKARLKDLWRKSVCG